MIADRQTIAEIFGVTADGVRLWQKNGCPHIPPADRSGTADARKVKYDSAEVHQWLLNRELARFGLRTRSTITEADILRALS